MADPLVASILIVEDDPNNRFALQRLLEGPGRNIVLAESGDQWDPLESTCRHASLSIL